MVAAGVLTQGTDAMEAAKYSAILHDFRYLKTPETFDEKIDADPVSSCCTSGS